MRKISLECPTADLREYRKLAELAKELGATHLSASQIEPSMWQWNVNRYDPYPNWSLHRPTVFKYIVLCAKSDGSFVSHKLSEMMPFFFDF